jgi:hypothetical protein
MKRPDDEGRPDTSGATTIGVILALAAAVMLAIAYF